MMASSSFSYQFQPQPPPVPRMTGGKRGPSGPLLVSSSSEDEDSDGGGGGLSLHSSSTLIPLTGMGPKNEVTVSKRPQLHIVQVLPLATAATAATTPRGGKTGFSTSLLSKDNVTVMALSLTTPTAAAAVVGSSSLHELQGDGNDCDAESDVDTTPSLPSSPREPGAGGASSPRESARGGGHDSGSPRESALSCCNNSPRESSAPCTGSNSPRESACSPRESVSSNSNFAHEHDHDYENVASPCSSTASGPIYVRPPGFVHHAQEFESLKSKIVRKKSRPAAVISLREGFKKREQTPPKSKPRRDPLPMRLRALPQSFWQQPNVTPQVSPATMFPVLPPLCNKDTEEDITEVRPVTPPQDTELAPMPMVESDTETTPTKSEKVKHHPAGERKITVANTDLLFKLFENIGGDPDKKPTAVHLKRGRPKKVVTKTACMKGLISGNDPYLVDAMSDKLFPQLSIETSSQRHGSGANTSLQLVTLGVGDKSVTLPSLSVEQNYPQMLSELVMNM